MAKFTVDITSPQKGVEVSANDGLDSKTNARVMHLIKQIDSHTIDIVKQVKVGFDLYKAPANSSIDIVLNGQTVQTISGDLYNKAVKLMGYKSTQDWPSLLTEYVDHIHKRQPAPIEKFEDFVASELQDHLNFARQKVKEKEDKYKPLVKMNEAAIEEWNKSVLPAGTDVAAVAQRIDIEEHILKGLKGCSPASLSAATGDPVQDSSLLTRTLEGRCKPAREK